MQYLTYNLLMYLLSPLWLAVTLRQAIKRRGGIHFIAVRMGWMRGARKQYDRSVVSTTRATDQPGTDQEGTDQQRTDPQFTGTETTYSQSPSKVDQTDSADTQMHSPARRTLWLHAASVGEVKSTIPLLEHISKAWPDLAIHFTCTTPESLGLLETSSLPQLTVEFCPIDFYGSANKLFKRLNPIALLIIETEIWPNLYRAANKHKVPLIIINGRISHKTLEAPQFVLSLYQQALPHVNLVLSRSDADTDNFRQLGIKDGKIKTLGNIKTYSQISKLPLPISELEGKRYLLAASTHAPEEQQLCEAFADTDVLLVIAPRHVQRSQSIQHMLTEKNIAFATRSRNEVIANTTRVYVADTTGEMDNLIANADIVFIGGSLVDHGGHNVLEPAVQSKPVVTGQHYKNFIAEVDLLSSHNAICIISSAEELVSIYNKLVAQPTALQTMGNAARQAIESSADVFGHYTTEIDKIISSHYSSHHLDA